MRRADGIAGTGIRSVETDRDLPKTAPWQPTLAVTGKGRGTRDTVVEARFGGRSDHLTLAYPEFNRRRRSPNTTRTRPKTSP